MTRLRIPNPYRPEWLAEFALRLASNPVGLVTWAGEDLKAGLSRLFEVSVLARAARFFVLVVDRHLQSSSAQVKHWYAGWEWE